MEQSTVFVLYSFNQAHKRMNVIYHDYAKAIGLSDAAFWLLYSVYEHGKPCTQKDLCQAWFYAPQTINSAIKAMQEQLLAITQKHIGILEEEINKIEQMSSEDKSS